ncbi:MAG: hypothetical protein ABFD60_17340, partial [Bryobacteraceae bacterium]
NQDTLALIRFAAKRFDYVGMRVQFAQEMAQFYRDKRARSASYRAVDLCQYINELKVAYRNLWLAENRPYWIEIVMVRFDNEALYWLQKERLFAGADKEFRTTKALPEPQALGLVLP